MYKYILMFLFISTILYCKEQEEGKEILIINIPCQSYDLSKWNCSFKEKEKKEKLGQEVFDQYKSTQKKLKNQLNNIFVPTFMSKEFKIDLDIDKINEFKIAYIYSPEKITGLNFKVEWDKNLKLSSSFKKDFDISKLIENTSSVLTNTFIPE